ncbi:MAG TPA: TolC family protein, partial [bacterium]|nr:TolC family protein [bacterium]
NELVYQVSQTYQEALLARELIRIAEEAAALADSQARFAERRFQQGYVSEFDYLRARTNRAGKEPAIITARNRYAVACDRMRQLLGDGAPEEFAPRGVLAWVTVTTGESAAVTTALARNAQLARLRCALQVQQTNLAYAQAQHYPDLNAAYSYNRQRLDYEIGGVNRPTGYYHDWSAGLTLSIPIFSGFATQAGVDKARAQCEQLATTVRQSEEQMALEVRTVIKQLAQNEQVIIAAEEGVRLAERSLRMARVSYDNGLSTSLDVQQAEVALTQARTDYATAVYGYQVNAAALAAVVGGNDGYIRVINPSANRSARATAPAEASGD